MLVLGTTSSGDSVCSATPVTLNSNDAKVRIIGLYIFTLHWLLLLFCEPDIPARPKHEPIVS